MLENEQLGYCFIDFNSNSKEAEIVDLVIDTPYRMRGYGKKFWNMIESYMDANYHPRKYFGEISPRNNYRIAASFWKSVGFEVDRMNISKTK
jgi:ribosomal protein S18 acetylase RimI-like enzyme